MNKSQKNNYLVDIIIVTYNAKAKLKLCLESVKRQTKDINYLLTIVNNCSTDGTFIFLKNYQKKNKNIKVINTDKNLGFSGGANIALRNTLNKFIVLLDDDAEVTEGWFHKLYNQIKDKPKVGIVGCKIVHPNNRIFSADYRVRPLEVVGNGEMDNGQRDYVKECDALIGACWLMQRELIKKVGYFDERFFPSQHEDIDYCLRTRLSGYKIIYNGKVKIIHYHLFRDEKQRRKNWQKFLQKWKELLHKFPLKDSHPVDKYIAKGIDCVEKKKFKQALIEFEKVESIDKRFTDSLYKGIALEGIGRYNEAIQQFQRFQNVLNLSHQSFLAHYNLVLLYKKLGLVKKAKRESKRTFDFVSYYNKFLS